MPHVSFCHFFLPPAQQALRFCHFAKKFGKLVIVAVQQSVMHTVFSVFRVMVRFWTLFEKCNILWLLIKASKVDTSMGKNSKIGKMKLRLFRVFSFMEDLNGRFFRLINKISNQNHNFSICIFARLTFFDVFFA